jgi:hypothetical protein
MEAPAQSPLSSNWTTRLLAGSALAFTLASSYYATQLLGARCEGFSCTYLGVAWLAWVAVLGLPATVLGYFAQRAGRLPLRSRFILRGVWLAHSLLCLGLLVWWLAS